MRRGSLPLVLLALALAWSAEAGADLDAAQAALARKEYGEAFHLLEELAEAGNLVAQYNLGLLYRKGLGTPRDDAAAARWFREAAEQGDGDAAFALGLLYARGEGVPRDTAEAYAWFRLASLRGNEKARENLYRVTRMMSPAQLAEARARADALSAER